MEVREGTIARRHRVYEAARARRRHTTLDEVFLHRERRQDVVRLNPPRAAHHHSDDVA